MGPIRPLRVLLAGLIVLAISACRAAAADAPVSIDVWAIPGVAAVADPTGRATLSDALAGRLHFKSGSATTVWAPASPLRPIHIWVRIPVAKLSSAAGPWYVSASRYLGRATLYARTAGRSRWTSTQFGLRIPYAQRLVARALPTARLPDGLAPHSFLYLDADADLYYIPLSIQNGAALAAEDTETGHRQRLVLLLCGIFLTLGLCNLLIFASTRELPYLLYSLSMFILAAIGPMQSSALAWEIFWPNASVADAASRYVALFSESYVSLIFAFTFLRTRQYAPRLATLVIVFLILAPLVDFFDVLVFPSFPLPFGLLTLADMQIAVTTSMWLLIVVLAVTAMRARVQGAGLIALAFGVVFACSTVYAASTYFWNDASRAWTYLLLLSGRVFEGFALFWALANRLQRTMAETLAATQQLLLETKRATTDPLTGIANRRVFDEALASELKRAQRDGAPLSLALFDIDHFKTYNDTYGHVAGDECLKAVALAIANAAQRPGDVAARYGGEEFALILPGTDEAAAEVIARDVCARVRILRTSPSDAPMRPVTISAGVAMPVGAHPDPESLIAAADAALYSAKSSGRDRVSVRSAAVTL